MRRGGHTPVAVALLAAILPGRAIAHAAPGTLGGRAIPLLDGAPAEAAAGTSGADQPATGSEGAERHARRVAERRRERDRRWHATGFLMSAVEGRLPAIPSRIVTGTLPFRPAYLVGGAVDRVVVPRFTIPLGFAKLRGNSLELEAQAIQHAGLEHDTELATAAVLRLPQFGVIGGTSANLAWGNGFSYAIQSPTYERGPGGQVGVDTVHFQYHMSFEVEATSAATPHLHYVLRLHHRSGIYGVISPSRTGSNYLGFGLRYDFGGR